MAKATPVTEQPEVAEQPAQADERLMEPAAPPPAPKEAPKADPKELKAIVAEAEKQGKKATVFGNAVRVDN